MKNKTISQWPLYKLSDLLSGFTNKNKNNELIPVYSVTNDTGFIISTDYFSKEVFSKNLTTYKIVEKGDFAYNPSRINVGSIDYFRFDEKGLISPLYVTFKIKGDLDCQFLKYYLKSPFGNIQIRNNTSGSVRDSLSFDSLGNISIPLPPLEDQKRIVRELDAANDLVQKRKQTIALLDDYLEAVFLEMFGDPVINPKGWELNKFGSIIDDIRYGSSEKSASNETENSVSILRIPNILNGYINYHDLKFQTLPQREVEKLTLIKGDLLFVRTNGNPEYIGRCAVFDDDKRCVFASYLIRVRLKSDNKFNPFFIRFCLSMDSYRGKIRKESKTTAGNYNINTTGIKSFDLIFPPKKLQDKFIVMLKSIEKLKLSMFAQSDQLEINFNAIMQTAFNPKSTSQEVVSETMPQKWYPLRFLQEIRESFENSHVQYNQIIINTKSVYLMQPISVPFYNTTFTIYNLEPYGSDIKQVIVASQYFVVPQKSFVKNKKWTLSNNSKRNLWVV